jgi:hypothetical protein
VVRPFKRPLFYTLIFLPNRFSAQLLYFLSEPDPMQDYSRYELHTLVDILAMQTSEYTQMMAVGIHDGRTFHECRRMIDKIQAAIWKKHKPGIRQTRPLIRNGREPHDGK